MNDQVNKADVPAAGWKKRLSVNFFGPDDDNELRAEYNHDYLQLLKSEYASFSPPSQQGNSSEFSIKVASLELKIRADLIEYRQRITLAELFELEMMLLKEMPDWAVRTKVWSARAVYHKLVGDDLYALYLASEPPNPKNGKVLDQLIRSDLYDLTKGKHWWYLNAIVMEHGMRRYRGTLRRWMTKGILAVLVVNLVSHLFGLIAPEHGTYTAALSAIFTGVYAGILGATVSIARRVKAATDVPLNDTDPVIRLSAIVNGNLGIQLSICIGGAFALLLYFMFVAGAPEKVLAIGMLPKFSTDCIAASKCTTTLSTFFGLIPNTAADLGKLLVWCFVAGFAEKFVPDILDKLAGMGGGSPSPATQLPVSAILPNAPTKPGPGGILADQFIPGPYIPGKYDPPGAGTGTTSGPLGGISTANFGPLNVTDLPGLTIDKLSNVDSNQLAELTTGAPDNSSSDQVVALSSNQLSALITGTEFSTDKSPKGPPT